MYKCSYIQVYRYNQLSISAPHYRLKCRTQEYRLKQTIIYAQIVVVFVRVASKASATLEK